ncbi:MAG: DUF4163 domain-containing protein [Sphingomonadales bacterium]|nr:MAG: DUF4163 domain-containing protein [Sphingomonadales bacterium]
MIATMLRSGHRREGVRRGSGQERSGAPASLARAAAAVMLLTHAACSSPEDIAAGAGLAKAESPVPTSTPPAPVPGKVAFTDNASKDEAAREFAYVWPSEASAIPALTQRLTAERDALLAAQKADWDEALREFADDDCGGCVNFSLEKTWEVVADLPRFLSLSATVYTYTGGAHGNGGYDALVWDRETSSALDPKAMFRSPDALQAALGDAWCKALKAERMKRLGEDYSDDGFFNCPPVADLTVLVGSSNGKTFDRIGLLAAHYVAGSYAEGTYEVTLPVTTAVLAAVKPDYKAAFALGK